MLKEEGQENGKKMFIKETKKLKKVFWKYKNVQQKTNHKCDQSCRFNELSFLRCLGSRWNAVDYEQFTAVCLSCMDKRQVYKIAYND